MAAQGENLVERAIAKAIDAGRDGQVALCEGTLSLTYGELAEKVRKTAAALQAKGVKPGERVAVYSPDCMDAALGLLGAMYAGAIALPISELSAANDVRNRLNDATASIVLAHHSLRAVVEEVRTEVESLKELITLSGEGDDDFGLLVETSDASRISRGATQSRQRHRSLRVFRRRFHVDEPRRSSLLDREAVHGIRTRHWIDLSALGGSPVFTGPRAATQCAGIRRHPRL
jgi:acyl-CoA synthetase (AMP-forming)/AMP-acid ligase II